MISAVWIIWALSFVLMSIFGQTVALRQIVLLLPFFFGFSVVCTFFASRSLAVSASIREGGSKQRGARAELTVSNKSFLPVIALCCELELHNLLTGEKTRQKIALPVLPKEKKKVALALSSKHCGNLRVSFKKSYALDFFGLTRFNVKFSKNLDAVVTPNTFAMRVLLANDSFIPEDSDDYEPNKIGSDVSEVHSVRNYREGDSVRQIHWKLTGKLDELIVKDYGKPLKHDLLVFADFSYRGKNKNTLPACLDALAEVAVSLSQALIDCGKPHVLAWRQTESTLGHYSVQNAEDLTDVLPSLLSAQSLDDSSLAQQGQQLFESFKFSQVLWLCTDVPTCMFETDAKITLMCCVDKLDMADLPESDALISFTPKSYQRDVDCVII